MVEMETPREVRRAIDREIPQEDREFLQQNGINAETIMGWYFDLDEDWDEFRERIKEARENDELQETLGSMDDLIQNLKKQIEQAQKVKKGLVQDQVKPEDEEEDE